MRKRKSTRNHAQPTRGIFDFTESRALLPIDIQLCVPADDGGESPQENTLYHLWGIVPCAFLTALTGWKSHSSRQIARNVADTRSRIRQPRLHQTCGAVAHENRSVPETHATANATIRAVIDGFFLFGSPIRNQLPIRFNTRRFENRFLPLENLFDQPTLTKLVVVVVDGPMR